MPKKKVVVIGGGNGSAIALEALKPLSDKLEISAVVTVSDSGGSSGRLRQEFNILPPGDIMRAVLALSAHEYKILKRIFYKNRFHGLGSKLEGHNLGNLFLVLLEKYSGDYMAAVRALEQAVESVGHVYPATLDKTDLCVELSNGRVVKTEASVDRPDYDRSLKIKKAWLEPSGNVFPAAQSVIEKADYIILSPGSLYTSLIPALLPLGAKEAIKRSKAKLWYTAFIANDLVGETGPEKLSDCVAHMEKYLPRPFDLIIYNNHKANRRQLSGYRERQWKVMPKDVENLSGRNILGCDLEAAGSGLDFVKLGKVYKKLLG